MPFLKNLLVRSKASRRILLVCSSASRLTTSQCEFTWSLNLENSVYSLKASSCTAFDSIQFSRISVLIACENQKLQSVPKNSALTQFQIIRRYFVTYFNLSCSKISSVISFFLCVTFSNKPGFLTFSIAKVAFIAISLFDTRSASGFLILQNSTSPIILLFVSGFLALIGCFSWNLVTNSDPFLWKSNFNIPYALNQ